MQRFKIYGGNLRTVKLSIEQQRTMITASDYAKRYKYSISAVKYGIAHGYIVARKFRAKWWILPIENTKTKMFL